MRILALDPATHCGWVYDNGDSVHGGTWDFTEKRDESGMRPLRMKRNLEEILDMGVDLVVFEAARHGAPKMQGALVVQAELQGIIKAECAERQIPYKGYSPSEIKKHATGKGNAGKPQMIAAARARGWNPVDDNHADAMWILDYAKKQMQI